MINWKFVDKTAFTDEEYALEIMQYIHSVNKIQSGGEFTICGICFDGDGNSTRATQSVLKSNENVTCPDCIRFINFCKKIPT